MESQQTGKRTNLPEGARIFAVGDIHGCHGKLATLLERLPIDRENDFLIFLGDYINRGPESDEVLRRLVEVGRTVRHAVFLLGNHEYALLEYARTGEPYHLRELRSIGVEETLKSYRRESMRSLVDLSFLPDDHRAFLHNLLPYFRLGNYLFVHAGVPSGETPETCPLDRLVSGRGVLAGPGEPGETVVVFGHTPFELPYVTSHRIGIDTGAVYGNLLTAVELPSLRFYHA